MDLKIRIYSQYKMASLLESLLKDCTLSSIGHMKILSSQIFQNTVDKCIRRPENETTSSEVRTYIEEMHYQQFHLSHQGIFDVLPLLLSGKKKTAPGIFKFSTRLAKGQEVYQVGGGSASTCNLHYFLNFLLYILVISNLFLFAVQNFRCFSRHFYSFFYFVFCLRSIGGFFCCKPIFSIDQSPPPHYSGPCIYNEHFYIYFLCFIFFCYLFAHFSYSCI